MAIIVLVTIPRSKSRVFSKLLLKKRVCACVNIVDKVYSFFWWEGKIDHSKESILIIKTKSSKFTQLKKIIKENHPYAVPEIISLKIDKIDKNYLEWLEQELNV